MRKIWAEITVISAEVLAAEIQVEILAEISAELSAEILVASATVESDQKSKSN